MIKNIFKSVLELIERCLKEHYTTKMYTLRKYLHNRVSKNRVSKLERLNRKYYKEVVNYKDSK